MHLKSFILAVFTLLINQIIFSQGDIIFSTGENYYFINTDKVIQKQDHHSSSIDYTLVDNIIFDKAELELILDPGFKFVRAIQSLKNPHIYYFIEIDGYTNKFRFVKLNKLTEEKEIVFDHNSSPLDDILFYPIAITATNNIIFNTSNNNTLEEHLGLWKYNLDSSTFTVIDIGLDYMSDPIINATRTMLIFTESQGERDLVHGTADRLISYDLASEEKEIVHQSKKQNIRLLGVSKAKNSRITKQLGCEAESFSSNVIYQLPFPPNENWCVTRDGSPRPCPSSITEICPNGHSGEHSYRAFDFAHQDWPNENNTNRPITAVADGTVVFVGLKGNCSYYDDNNELSGGGYGNTIMIEHADGYMSLYGHLERIDVQQNEVIKRGQAIGIEGGSGLHTQANGCGLWLERYARHLHLETRRSLTGSVTEYIKFADIGTQTPRTNDVVRATHIPDAPIPSFVCRGCDTDLAPVCHSLSASVYTNTITINQFAIENLQGAEAVNFTVGYYLSSSNSLSGSTPLGFQSVNIVYGNDITYVNPITFNTPNLSDNYYYIIAVVDAPNTTGDIDINNNFCYGYGPVYIGGSATCNDGIQNQGELEIDCGGPCPTCSSQANLVSQTCVTPIVNGEDITLLYEISNLGSQASGNFTIGFYAYKSGSGIPHELIDIRTNHASISGNTSQVFNLSFNLHSIMTSAGLTAGDYKIGLVLDEYFQVTESNENDNFCVNQTYFNYSTLNITNGSNCLQSQVSGEYLFIDHTFINTGNIGSQIFGYQFLIYESQSDLYYPLGPTYSVINLPANSSTDYTAAFHLETEMNVYGLPDGEYGLAIYADYDDILTETNEGDNFCLSNSTFTYSAGCNTQDGFIEGAFSGELNFNAPNYITTPNVNNQCIILPDATIHMTAGNHINLKPGFETNLGSTFSASIEDCADVNSHIVLDDPNTLISLSKLKDKNSKSNIQYVEDHGSANGMTQLHKNDIVVSPNPFTDQTVISFNTEHLETFSLLLSSIDGRVIKTLKDKVISTSDHYDYILNGRDLKNGPIIISLVSNQMTISKKIIKLN